MPNLRFQSHYLPYHAKQTEQDEVYNNTQGGIPGFTLKLIFLFTKVPRFSEEKKIGEIFKKINDIRVKNLINTQCDVELF